jgi:hypothetical protein
VEGPPIGKRNALGIEWFFEWDFEELALQPAGSRAQDAIKRLDCRCAVKLPVEENPVFGAEALDLRF